MDDDNNDRVESDSLIRRFLNWKSISVFWLLFALLPCLVNLLTSQFSEWAKPLLYIAKTEGLSSFTWILLTPVVFWMAARYPIFGKRWFANLLIHIATGIIVPLIQATIFLLLYRPLISREEVQFFDHLVILLDYHLYGGVLVYWFLALIYHVLAYVDRYRYGERRASRIRELLVESRLEVLKTQMQPHFLFNTLHTIGSLIRLEKKEPALETLADLGELLRQSLYNDGHESATLVDELSFIKRYLKIELQRFRDRLTVEYRIDPQAEAALIPPFLLQPLVENAIKHGICGTHDAGCLEIVAYREGDKLHLEVHDDGPGLSETSEAAGNSGIGLRNTKDRLRQLYGDNFALVVRNRPVRGAAAVVIIPFRTGKSGGDKK